MTGGFIRFQARTPEYGATRASTADGWAHEVYKVRIPPTPQPTPFLGTTTKRVPMGAEAEFNGA